jgi:hypothetical protein
MKICPVAAQLFYASRQADERTVGHEELTFDFRNFANASKNQTKKTKSDVTNNNARLCAFFQPTAEDKPNFTANSPCRAVPCGGTSTLTHVRTTILVSMYLSAEVKNTWSYPPTFSPPWAFTVFTRTTLLYDI